MSDTPIDFSSLLARANAQIAQKESLDKTKSRLKKEKLTLREREELQEQVQAIQDVMEWRTSGVALVIPRYRCACGRTHYGPGQVMLKMEHLRVANTVRLVAHKGHLPEGLPRFQVWQDNTCEACILCGEDHGFKMDWRNV